MIRRVRLANFKRFVDQTFELDCTTVLAGPNNSGKSTLLQAIALWKDALDLWVAQRRDATRTVRRTGVGINRLSCNAVPVRDVNLLWNDRVVSGGNGPGATRLLEIAVQGESGGEPWACGLLRNLLWEIGGPFNPDRSAWESLTEHLGELFRIELRPPAYSASEPYIRCEYREAGRDRPLDLSSAGSGTLQVVMLLAFLYRSPGTVLLLDEPDAHQHVILQRDVYALLRKIAHERNGQLIIATHSPAMLEATEPERVLSFTGASPRALRTL